MIEKVEAVVDKKLHDKLIIAGFIITFFAVCMNLFWEKGYGDTSIQDLVNHLGINRGSLYATYGGKRELFDKAFKK